MKQIARVVFAAAVACAAAGQAAAATLDTVKQRGVLNCGANGQLPGFGLPDAPKTNVPPPEADGEDPHDKVRVLKAAMSQSDVFFKTGQITTTCDGVCDPE